MGKDSKRAKGPEGEFVGYARVSTQEQNLDMQLERLRAYPCARIFQDKLSASAKHREGWNDCWRYLREGDTLVIYSMSRLARSVEELTKINRGLMERSIAIVSLSEPIDTRTAAGKLMFNINAAMAQWERDITVERTRAGIATRKAAGLWVGRPSRFDKEKLAAIRRDLIARKGGDYLYTVKQVMKAHKIKKPLLNYYFPGGRQKIKRK